MPTDLITWLTEHPNEANAIAGVGNLFVAAIALIVAAASIILTYKTSKAQQQYNVMSVRPYAFIACADYENLIRVKVRNDGIGPLIVKSLDVTRVGARVHEDLVSYMPELPPQLSWSNFSSGYVRSIRPGDDLFLLELELDTTKRHHVVFRDECRKRLAELQIEVNYTDIFGTNLQPARRNLEWFGRRLASSRAKKVS